MTGSQVRPLYRWYYNHVACHYYNIMMVWCCLPLGGERKMRNTLLSCIDLKPDDRILEMCCGTGSLTLAAAAKMEQDTPVKAVDISWGQIEIANRRNTFPNVEFLVMDASDTTFPDGAFDKVFIPHALHEMYEDMRLAVLREAYRILADGGTLIVMEMDIPPNILLRWFVALWWFYWLPFNFETPTRREMLKHGLKRELREAGFQNITKTSVYGGTLQVMSGIRLMPPHPPPILGITSRVQDAGLLG